MKVIEFKSRITKGAKVKVQLFHEHNGEYILAMDYPVREVSKVQTKSFAFKTWKEDTQKWTDSWADWPKADQLQDLPGGRVAYVYEFGKLIYEFL